MINILLCAPVHEKKEIFELYLKHLRKLEIPEGVNLHKHFILHNCEHLKDCLIDGETCEIYNNTTEYKKTDVTHNWNAENFSDVVKMKNKLIDIATITNNDYIFFVDSDLMLHPKTLKSLYDADKDMIAEIFWTQWDKNPQNVGPNCWHIDHYNILQADYEKWLNVKGYYEVGMTGACTLIKRKVFTHDVVNWNQIRNVSFSIWEDRAFCIRVASAGFKIFIDTHYPAFHCYREKEYQKFIKDGGLYE